MYANIRMKNNVDIVFMLSTYCILSDMINYTSVYYIPIYFVIVIYMSGSSKTLQYTVLYHTGAYIVRYYIKFGTTALWFENIL